MQHRVAAQLIGQARQWVCLALAGSWSMLALAGEATDWFSQWLALSPVWQSSLLLVVLILLVVSLPMHLLLLNRRFVAQDKRYRELINTLPIAFIVTDSQQRIIDWNAAATRIFGYPRSAVLDQDALALLVNSEDKARVRTVMQEALERGETTHSINRNQTADGRELTCEWYNSLYYGDKGEVAGLISLGTDITDREYIQHELVKSKAQADYLLNDQRQFTAMMAHQLRTPLSVIDAAAMVLSRLTDESNQQSHAVIGRIRRGVNRLKAFIDNSLTADRLDRLLNGGLQCKQEQIVLPLFLEGCVDQITHDFPNHELRLDCPESLPDLYGDATLLETLLHNVLGNACKYSPAGSLVQLNARLGKSGLLELVVIDQGCGINADEIDKVRSRHYRGRNDCGVHGTGLGLFLTDQIIRLHHGQLLIESEVNRGTTMTVSLPVTPPPAGQETA
jgi:PAS domain S-box-containing protein